MHSFINLEFVQLKLLKKFYCMATFPAPTKLHTPHECGNTKGCWWVYQLLNFPVRLKKIIVNYIPI